jgi:hypothetical protein
MPCSTGSRSNIAAVVELWHREQRTTVGRRRFDRQFTASRLLALDQRLDLCSGFSSNVIARPSSQRLCIGKCGPRGSESALESRCEGVSPFFQGLCKGSRDIAQ